jgi:Ser/Thr protein kinase RdoA (MazF antagonist)
MPDARNAAVHFVAAVRSVEPFGTGIINDTFLVTAETPGPRKLILQRLNRHVFPEPARIMDNLRTLQAHVEQRRSAAPDWARALQLPTIQPTLDGLDYYVDPAGGFWRALRFIDHTRCLAAVSTEGQGEEIGFALGRFHAWASDLDPRRLHDTLPGFHITPGYLRELDRAAAQAPSRARSGEVRACLDFVEARRHATGVLEEAKQAGILALRTTHGDPKLSNFLFDAETGHAAALVDLDTVQPGLVHYDLGDCLRSCCNTAGEQAADRGCVAFDVDICRAILQGYLGEARRFLAAADYAYLQAAIRLIPLELGIRFLTDHLQGDVYFKTDAPGQNLQRAITQFQLTASIERSSDRIGRIIAGLAAC